MHNVWLSARSEGEVQAGTPLTHPDGSECAFCKSDGNGALSADYRKGGKLPLTGVLTFPGTSYNPLQKCIAPSVLLVEKLISSQPAPSGRRSEQHLKLSLRKFTPNYLMMV